MKLEVNFVMDYHMKKTPCTTHLIILIDSVNESDNIITLKRKCKHNSGLYTKLKKDLKLKV